jgi:hypothetical protein
MSNKFGIPDEELKKIRARDKRCVYCHKKMIEPCSDIRRDWASIEHFNCNGPFYWNDELQIEDIAYCCISCNSSRGVKKLSDWFKTKYCIKKNINENTVADPVKKYLDRKRKKSRS